MIVETAMHVDIMVRDCCIIERTHGKCEGVSYYSIIVVICYQGK